MRALRSLRFLAVAAFLLPWAARADTTQAWYQNNVWWRVNERVSLGNYLDFRLNNAVGRAHTWLISPRIRLRPNLEWLPRKEGFFRGLYTNDEFFYDFERRRLTENRWTPLGVIFRAPGDVELRVYYLWRRTLGGGGWVNYHVLGAMASLNF
jgi:hypothetical protein